MILHRYIASTVIKASLLVIIGIIGLTFFVGLLGELQDVGTGDYRFSQAVIHVLLKTPHDAYQFFPMLVLLGGVLGLGILSSHHELVVMRASGISIAQIVKAVVSAALLLIFIATLLGEGVAPRAVYLADKLKQSAENGGQAVATASGVWIHEGNNFLHIDRVVGTHRLENVKRYQFNDQHQLLAAYYVKAMDFHHGQWLLHNMVKTVFSDNQTQSQQFDETTWDLALNPGLLHVGLVEPEEMSLLKLHRYTDNLVKNGLQASRFQFEFWKRIFQPFATIVMMLLAIPFVLSASSRSTTMGWRMLLGVMIGFVFYILNAFLGQLSIVFQLPPWLAALFPMLLFSVVLVFYGYYYLEPYRKQSIE